MRVRRAVRMIAIAAATLVFVVACGGADREAAGAAARLVDPDVFAAAVAEPGRVTVNVHVPDEGSIDGTALSIPFDEIEARQGELPDASTPLAIYCRSGRMSAIAAQTLAALGFTDIVELRGGMLAWEDAGRSLIAPGAR